MTIEEMREKYPIGKTLIGFYGEDGTITIPNTNEIEDIKDWEYAPLDQSIGYMPFMVYKGNNEFECCYFSYVPLKGYYTENGTNYKLVSDWEDFGIEISSIYEYDDQHIIITPDVGSYSSLEEASKYENMLETAAWAYDSQAYNEGKIITSYEQLKNFVRKLEENK